MQIVFDGRFDSNPNTIGSHTTSFSNPGWLLYVVEYVQLHSITLIFTHIIHSTHTKIHFHILHHPNPI